MLDENEQKELQTYTHLCDYVGHFLLNQGKAEHDGYLCNLIIWFRNRIPQDADMQELFGWTDEVAEDFYSWGHNSRWGNTFWEYLDTNMEDAVRVALELARQYGDFDVEEMFNQKDEK